jgi:hypothetical protein
MHTPLRLEHMFQQLRSGFLSLIYRRTIRAAGTHVALLAMLMIGNVATLDPSPGSVDPLPLQRLISFALCFGGVLR